MNKYCCLLCNGKFHAELTDDELVICYICFEWFNNLDEDPKDEGK